MSPPAFTRAALRGLVPAVLAVSAGCAESLPFQSEPASDRLGVWIPGPGATLLSTGASRLDNPTMAVVSSSAAWLDMWSRAWGGIAGSPTLPPPVLYATEWQLGASCDLTAGLSAPLHMVHAPGHPPVIDWRVGVARRDCEPG